jgi:phage shock protein E
VPEQSRITAKETKMKKVFAVWVISIASLSCVQSDYDGAAKVKEGALVIDVRTAKEFKEGHLQDAINIPYTEIGEKIDGYVKSKEAKLTLYCRSGRRSAIAKKTLEKLGFKRVVDAGAYAKLKEQEMKSEE